MPAIAFVRRADSREAGSLPPDFMKPKTRRVF
jgi:hypothetical protein